MYEWEVPHYHLSLPIKDVFVYQWEVHHSYKFGTYIAINIVAMISWLDM